MDERHLHFAPLRSPGPIVELAKDNPRQIENGSRFQVSCCAEIVPEVRHDDIRISRTLPAGFIDPLAALLYYPVQFAGFFR